MPPLQLQKNLQFTIAEEQAAIAVVSAPKEYLYEPNGPLLKAGAFNYLANTYRLKKLHRNTHLYTSDVLRSFPGSVYRIEEIMAYTSRAMAKRQDIDKFMIKIRNFPNNIDSIKKRLKIKEGGDKVLFAVTLYNNKPALLLCSRILT